MNKKILKLLTTIPGWLSPKEATFLESAVKQTAKRAGEIVEIGSFCGKSTICLSLSKGTVYAIDPHKGNIGDKRYKPTYTKFLTNLKTAGVSKKVKPLVKTSAEAAKNWKKKIRVLFIDGLHDEKHAMQDFHLWSPFVVEGGIIAIHDSYRRWCGSEKSALRNIVHSPHFGVIGYIDSLIYGIKGKPTTRQRFAKVRLQLFIQTMITLEHGKIVLTNLPEIVKKIIVKEKKAKQLHKHITLQRTT